MRVSVGGQRPAEEGGAEVDGDAGEPDHEQAEGDALRAVLQERESVLRVLVRKDGGVIEDRGQQVDGGDGDQEEEGCLHQGALADGLTEEYWPSHRQQDGSSGTVNHRLVEYQALAPSTTSPL